MYIQPIGDLKGSVGDFRGYGSGGGSDATRGAGFVELNASHTLQLDGAVLANGGFDAASSASRSGSGGTIRLSAKILNGKGRAEACGGNATAPGEDSTGGGGGGGGGRVVLEYAQGNRGTLSVHVHGGTHAWEMPSLWCQEGGTGTYLEIVRANSTTVQGTIWIVGRRKEPPAGLMAGTPLFYRTARRELMVEPWMLHVRVAQHALVFASTLQLHANSSIEVRQVEAGSFWATLVFNETIQLMASSITIAVGGEVMPAKGGAGRAFEAIQGGKGGGLVVLVVKAITLAEGSVVSVRGGNGTHGGGGGSGGTIVLGDVADIVGDGALDLSGGSGSTTYVGTSEEQVHGGGGGGGVLWIRYQDKGSGKDFHGRVALNGGFSAGQTEHATYNQKGSCVYMCEKGHIGLDCLTPFEKFIQPIGGPVGFVLFCFVTILSVFGIYGYVSSSYGGTLPAVMKQYRAVRAPTPHSNSTHLPRLTDHQLTFHVARLYFGGRNTFCQPWHVPTDLVVGSDLRKTIYEGSYAGFASKCNAICTGHAKAWSTAAHVERLARLAVPPLATWMLRRYQRSTVKQLFEYMTEYGTGFFRDLDLQASGAHLILGYSSDYSLGYIDLLLSPDAARRTPQIPPPPLPFVAAGHGSFLCPFYLDTNDAWLRAVPSRVEILRDSVWLEFVAALNQHLRLLSPSGSIESILDHVEAFNSTDMLNGHTVRTHSMISEESLPSDEQQSAFRPAAVVTTPTTPDECFERVFESKPLPEHSKWAIYVVPNDRRHAHRHLEPPAASSISAAPRTTPTSKPSPAAMAEMSSIRYAALYAPDPATVPSTNTTPLLSADDDDASTSRYRGNVLARRTMSMDMSAWTSSFLAPWSNVPVVATPYRWLLPYSLLLLLSMDFFTMLWILIEYFCIQVLDPMAKSTGCSQVAFELVLLCMPGAIVGAPVLGIVFVLQRHSFLGRLFVLWTHVCWINMLGALVCDAVYHAYLGEYVLVLVLAVMAMKYLETHVALYVLAQFEGSRIGRGWKGLFTTQEYYDAAYRRF
ncbi:hypothetical protein DYB32_003016 [Aphanomyces invadans]|uniref:Uncharacterized protein n=1 Tax=Aphanomyces invadans TaxID=157072 RepID=A0A3R7D3A5_9STRA|nr:hypothetical protein DYB32_003016 [Aphanomyces invadans]